MEKFKFIEPILIKAGSSQIKLGMFEEAPKFDCRVLSEDTYQELKKAYDLVCDSQKANTGEKQCNLPFVITSFLKDKAKQHNVEPNKILAGLNYGELRIERYEEEQFGLHGIEHHKQCFLQSVTNRTFKCLGCKHYDVKVINDKGGIARICKVKENDHRIIVDLDAPNCTDYVYGC